MEIEDVWNDRARRLARLLSLAVPFAFSSCGAGVAAVVGSPGTELEFAL